MSKIAVLSALFAGQLAAPPPEGPTSLPSGRPLPPPTAAQRPDRWPGANAYIGRLAHQAERAAATRDRRTLARVVRLWNMNHLLERRQRVQAAMNRVSRSRAGPLARAQADFFRRRMLRAEGEIQPSRQVTEQLGLFTQGWMAGPFDNAAGAGHGTAFPPEQTPSLDGTMPGKVGPVSWRSLVGLAPDGVFELSALVHASEEATVYVATLVEATRAAKAALRVGSTDQLRVFQDGRELFAQDTRRFAHLDQTAIPVELRRGDNLFLIKVSWLGRNGRLLARLTKPNGRRLSGVRAISDRDRFARALAAPPRPARIPTHRVRKLTDGLSPRRDPGLWADLVAVAGLYDHRKLPTPMETSLERAIRADPGNPMARFLYAHRVALRDPARAQEQLQAALTADAGFAPALLELGVLARRAGRLLDARAYLDRAIRADPTLVAAHVARAELGFEDLDEGALAAVRLQQAEHLPPAASVSVALARMYHRLSHRARAREFGARALKAAFDHREARTFLANVEADARNSARALALIDDGIRLFPHALPLYLRKARLLAAQPETETAARAFLARAGARFADSPRIPQLEAELWLFGGNSKQAIASLDRALILDPQQPVLRRHRRALTQDRHELEDAYAADAVALVKEPVTDDERSWGAAYLTDRRAVRLFDNGKSTRFGQFVIRLSKAQLEDGLRIQRIPYAPSREAVEILDAERIRPSGQRIKASRIEDRGPPGKVSGMYIDQRAKVIVFDDIEIGDVIHVAYRIDSIGPNIFGGFFGDVAALSAGIPKKDVRVVAISPAHRPLYVGRVRAPEPVRTEREDEQIVSWRLDRVAPIEPEPLGPPYAELGSMVSVSTYASWSDLGAWYARLFREQLELDAAAREAGRGAVRGARSVEEKVRRLYDYVVKNTRYVGIELGIHGWKPFPASEVHRRRYGDCKDKSTLLSALLRDNGIDATIVLVRTRDRGFLPEDHATMWAFNHAITYVPELDLFLDPTAEFSGSTELPHLDQGAQALVVRPDGETRLLRLPSSRPEDNLNESAYVATLSGDSRLLLEGVERFAGARAARHRQDFQEKDDRPRRLTRQLSQIFAGIRVESVEFSDLDDLEQPVSYRYRAVVPRYGRQGGPDGARLSVPVALFRHELAQAYGQLTERQHPIFLRHPWQTTNRVRYRLPEGARVDALPEGVSIDSKHISLEQRVRPLANGFETRETVTVKSRVIPAEDYPDFRRACLAIDRAMGRGVSIQW